MTSTASISSSVLDGAKNASSITLNIDRLSLEGHDASTISFRTINISSSSNVETMGCAGRVTIQGLDGDDSAASSLLVDGGQLLTHADGDGAAGKIMVRAEKLGLVNGAEISATTQGVGEADAVKFLCLSRKVFMLSEYKQNSG